MTPRARQGLAAAVAVLLSVHFARFFDAEAPIQTDTRYYVYFARTIAEGGTEHVDYFDNKTQLASLAGALFYRAGLALGVEPLSAIRIGYLGLVALGGWLTYLLYRRFAQGNGWAALLALLPFLGFSYLGTLPAVGNVPKVLVAVSASAACLAFAQRRFLLAGALSALAPLDWQIGVLVPLGLLAGAALERPRRGPLLRIMAGGLGVALVYTLHLVARGALGDFLEQTVGAAFARGEGPFLAVDILQRRLRSTSGDELWLVALALAGLLHLPWWVARGGERELRGARLALAIVHLGVLAFSLRDFQGSGDTMLLLHSAAFFAAVLLLALAGPLERLGPKLGQRSVGLVLAIAVLGLAVRPLGGGSTITTRDSPEGTRLADQRRFRAALAPHLAARRVLLLGPSELLFLDPFETETNVIYWNAASAHVFDRRRDQTSRDSGHALVKLVEELKPDLLLTKLFFRLPPGLPYAALDAPELAQAGPYQIRVLARTADDGRR